MWTLLALACGTPDAPSNNDIQPAAAAAVTEAVSGVACDVQLFPFTDTDVYERPERGANVTGAYPEGTLLRVSQLQGPWAKVAPADATSALPSGWMGIQLLTTHLRTAEEYGVGKGAKYRDEPGATAGQRVPDIDALTVEACKDDFIRVSWETVEGKAGAGWLATEDHCPLSNTSCP